LVLGTYLDGFFHHNLPATIDSFFTPWHAVLYSGFLSVAAFILFHQARNMLRGHAWNRALPAGYGLSLLGVPLFMVAGVGDAIWHTLFGFEAGLEALLSPTHLLLAASAILILSGPWRAAVNRPRAAARTATPWSAVLSLLMLLSILTFFTDYANALVNPFLIVDNPVPVEKYPVVQSPIASAFQYHREAQGLAGVFVITALIVGILLLAIQNGTLPNGSLILIVSGNGLLMAGFHFREVAAYPQVLVPLLASGLIAEIAYRWLRPAPARGRETQWFAFGVPFVLFALYFGVLVGTAGVWWSIHMWTGAIFLAGVVGLLLSLVAVPMMPQTQAGASVDRP